MPSSCARRTRPGSSARPWSRARTADGRSRTWTCRAWKKHCDETRAEAAWPGWGFVAEQPDFAELCERLGVTFIGPSPAAMRALGDKIASKRLAEGLGIPLVPWAGAPAASEAEAARQAAELGFPVMVKATGGVGGRGVREAETPGTLPGALKSARAEAWKWFGQATVFLERRLDGVRHVDVQVVSDAWGGVWALPAREASIQRRHQKLVEESPVPGLSPAREAAMRRAAARLVQAVGYVGAAAVEFLYDPGSEDFWFLEANTRLEVEHGVSEVTTGLDLVKLQVHVARGGRLARRAARGRGARRGGAPLRRGRGVGLRPRPRHGRPAEAAGRPRPPRGRGGRRGRPRPRRVRLDDREGDRARPRPRGGARAPLPRPRPDRGDPARRDHQQGVPARPPRPRGGARGAAGRALPRPPGGPGGAELEAPRRARPRARGDRGLRGRGRRGAGSLPVHRGAGAARGAPRDVAHGGAAAGRAGLLRRRPSHGRRSLPGRGRRPPGGHRRRAARLAPPRAAPPDLRVAPAVRRLDLARAVARAGTLPPRRGGGRPPHVHPRLAGDGGGAGAGHRRVGGGAAGGRGRGRATAAGARGHEDGDLGGRPVRRPRPRGAGRPERAGRPRGPARRDRPRAPPRRAPAREATAPRRARGAAGGAARRVAAGPGGAARAHARVRRRGGGPARRAVAPRRGFVRGGLRPRGRLRPRHLRGRLLALPPAGRGRGGVGGRQRVRGGGVPLHLPPEAGRQGGRPPRRLPRQAAAGPAALRGRRTSPARPSSRRASTGSARRTSGRSSSPPRCRCSSSASSRARPPRSRRCRTCPPSSTA